MTERKVTPDPEADEDDAEDDELPPDDQERDYLRGSHGTDYDPETRRP